MSKKVILHSFLMLSFISCAGQNGLDGTDLESRNNPTPTPTPPPSAFSTRTDISLQATNGLPLEILSADLNSDGKMDLVVGLDSRVVVLFNEGSRTFSDPKGVYAMSVAGYPLRSLAVGNIDGLGPKNDLLIADDEQIAVVYGETISGTPTKKVLATYNDNNGSQTPLHIAAGDLDSDGIDEIVLSRAQERSFTFNTYDGYLEFLRYDPATATFPVCVSRSLGIVDDPSPFYPASVRSDVRVAVGNVVPGNHPDIVATQLGANGNGEDLLIQSGGAGACNAQPGMSRVTFQAGYHPQALAFASIFGDGSLDLLVGFSGVIHAFAGNPSLDKGMEILTSFHSLAAADNVSGVPLMATIGNQSLDIFEGSAMAKMSPAELKTGTTQLSLAVQDLDGDGETDVIVGTQDPALVSGGGISIFYH